MLTRLLLPLETIAFLLSVIGAVMVGGVVMVVIVSGKVAEKILRSFHDWTVY